MSQPSRDDTANFGGSGNQGLQVGQITGNVAYYSGGPADPAGLASLSIEEDELSLPFSLPTVAAVERFVGREKELSRIQAAFEKGPKKRNIVILYGLGGIGKTQLATKYASDHRDDYKAVLWLNGTDAESLEQSFAEAAQRLSDEHPTSTTLRTIAELQSSSEVAMAMVRWLGRGNIRKWLLIFDNVDDIKLPDFPDGALELSQYIPKAGHGHIIITTRLSELDIGTCIPVQPLTDVNESLGILASMSRRPNVKNDPHALALAQRLAGLPLALSSAGALLRQTSISFEAYLENYEQSWHRLQKMTPKSLEYPARTLQTTWNLSLERVEQINRDAVELLRLWSYLDHRDIWYKLIAAGKEAAPKLCPLTMEDELDFHEAMKVLRDHCLADSLPESDGYGCHPCVHDWIRNMPSKDDDSNLEQTAFLGVGMLAKVERVDKYWLLRRRILPHANRFIDYIIPEDSENAAAYLQAIHNIGELSTERTKYETAGKLLQRALEGRTKIYGPEHAETLFTVHALGRVHMHRHHFQTAEALFKQALAGMEKLYGPSDTKTLSTVYSLGNVYREQRKLDEAEILMRRALAGWELLGPKEPKSFQALNGLGNIHFRRNQYKEAIIFYQRSLDGKTALDGPNHASTYSCLRNLTIAHRKEGNLDEAEAFCLRSLAGCTEWWGPEHIKTLEMTMNLAVIYERQQKFDQAKQQYQRAIAGYERVLGPDAAMTLRYMMILARMYVDERRFPEAEPLLQQVYDGYCRRQEKGCSSAREAERLLNFVQAEQEADEENGDARGE